MEPRVQALIDRATFHQLQAQAMDAAPYRRSYAQGGYVGPASLAGIPIHTSDAVPPGSAFIVRKEDPMGPNPYRPLTAFEAAFAQIIRETARERQEREAAERERTRIRSLETAFERLDVQNGDVIELRYKEGTSILQGKVAQVRQQTPAGDGVRPTLYPAEFQVRIEGFGETPHGSHNVWFAIRNFDSVRVVERAYPWTDRDRVVASIAGVSAVEKFPTLSEDQRNNYRKVYGEQADRVLAALKG